jgi:hypothetical protein
MRNIVTTLNAILRDDVPWGDRLVSGGMACRSLR